MKMIVGALLALLGQWFHARLTTLEDRMALTETALADLDQATNEIADELDELRNQLTETDATVASQIGAAAARLRGLAADPENPVPTAPATGEPGA
jgi:uncharacterized coiled-coil protein SlyX